MPAQKETVNGSAESKAATTNGTAKKDHETASTTSSVPSKRKAKKASDGETPSKAPRRSARGQPAKSVEHAALIKFLLSEEAVHFSQPHDELDAVKEHGNDKNYRTYSSGAGEFSAFEELMCAVILSRPISHALGVRSIRTLLNEPYNFTTPKALTDAGYDGIWQAVEKARTQHRQKTAAELESLANLTTEKFGDSDIDTSLGKLRKDCGDDEKKVGRAESRMKRQTLILLRFEQR